MTAYRDTDAAEKFVGTADARQTSIEIMEAIAFFAADEKEAQTLWEFGEIPGKVDLLSVWEHATNNGLIDDQSLDWGDRTLAQIMTEAAAEQQQ